MYKKGLKKWNTGTLKLRVLLWLHCIRGTWLAGGTRQTATGTNDVSIFLAVPPRLVSQHRRNSCTVSIERRWWLASHLHLTQISCQPASYGVQRCDNWWVCTDTRTWECLLHYSWEFLDHPVALVSCPVISISLGLLEKYLASRQFSVDGDVKAGVTCPLQTHDTNFLYDILQALVPWEGKYRIFSNPH